MTRIQIIERNGKPAFYLVPAATWERVREAIEDAEDAIEYEQAVQSDDGLRFPLPVAMALAEGRSRRYAGWLRRSMCRWVR
jgi:hypothetical protein